MKVIAVSLLICSMSAAQAVMPQWKMVDPCKKNATYIDIAGARNPENGKRGLDFYTMNRIKTGVAFHHFVLYCSEKYAILKDRPDAEQQVEIKNGTALGDIRKAVCVEDTNHLFDLTE